MIKNCAVTMECKLTNIVELPTNHFFIGEITNAYAEAPPRRVYGVLP